MQPGCKKKDIYLAPRKTILKPLMSQLDYPILKLHCAACAHNVETIAAEQPGVEKASASYATGILTIEAGLGFNPERLKRAIQEVGYDIIIDDSDPFAEQEKENKKLHAKLKKKVIVVWIMAIPLMVLGMAHDWKFFSENTLIEPVKNQVMMWLAFFILVIGGREFIQNAWKLLRKRTASMDTLVALSTIVSFLFSLFTLYFPDYWKDHGLDVHVYFEASGMIVAFVLLGRLMESHAKNDTAQALQDLIHLQPDTAFLIEGDGEREVPVQELRQGQRVSVHPGSRIPVDGVVAAGSSYVDESMITGEAIPVVKQPGSRVLVGTINQRGSLEVEITAVGKTTILAGVVRMVRQAQSSKAPMQHVADKVVAKFVPVIIGLSILTLSLWLLIGGIGCLSEALLCALSVLVIACPCALGLATPTALLVGMDRAAHHRILIKDAAALANLCRVNAIALDKTGTLTMGKPSIVESWISDEVPTSEWAALFKKAEQKSEHPISSAIIHWIDENVDSSEALTGELTDYEVIPGRGVEFCYRRKDYWIGGMSLLRERAPKTASALRATIEQWQEKAYTLVFFGQGNIVFFATGVSDPLKPCAQEVVRGLRNQGVDVYLLTGDHEKVATAVANQLGIRYYKAEMTPQDKQDYINWLQEEGYHTAMVGDGINDSQALAAANVSIALKHGTDIAVNVASVVLVGSEDRDIAALPKAMMLSRKTYLIIKQNLFWAFIYNLVGIVLASGVFGMVLNPMIASAAMALSSVSVVANSLRLKWAKFE